MKINHEIIKCAEMFEINESLIQAIIDVESNGHTYATRYEPNWKYHYKVTEFAYLVHTTVLTERCHQATSWGLMQVMGTVARERGFEGPLPQLCDPARGILYGCKHLAGFLDKYDVFEDAIAAYNAGSPRKLVTGEYENQAYVDKVIAHHRIR